MAEVVAIATRADCSRRYPAVHDFVAAWFRAAATFQ
jgi:hypothetical protein